jgi:site-specific recombinase XerD
MPTSDSHEIGITQSDAGLISDLPGWQLARGELRGMTLYHLRHTFATRLSAGGVADHFVTQMLRQGDARVFKRYSQAKLTMMREALAKIDRHAN